MTLVTICINKVADFDRPHPEWTPEEGSPAWFRDLSHRTRLSMSEILKAMGSKTRLELAPPPPKKANKHRPMKSHWDGGVNCAHVMHHKYAKRAVTRILKGYAFDALKMEDRCGNCNNQFLNS